MSDGPESYRDIGVYIELFGRIIEHAQRTGRRGDWARLARKLDAIRSRIDAEGSARNAMTSEHRDASTGFGEWLRVLTEVLLPEHLERLLEELVALGEVPAETWALLDADRSARTARTRARRGIAAECAIYAAAQRCRPSPSAPRVHEALGALEELRAVRSEPMRDEDVLDAACRSLTVALTRLFPPAARAALVGELEVRWRVRTDGTSAGSDRRGNIDRLHRHGGLGDARHIWEDILPQGHEVGPRGSWFTPDLQRDYELIHQRRVRAETERREAEEARVREVQAEQRRVAAERAAREAQELADKIAELEAWEEDEPRRRAAAVERIAREAPEIAYYELRNELLARHRILKAIMPRTEREEMIREKEVVVRTRLEADMNRQERTEKTRRREAVEALRVRSAGSDPDGPLGGAGTRPAPMVVAGAG